MAYFFCDMTYVISLRWLANPNETLAIQNFAHMNIEVIIKVKIITNLQSFLKKLLKEAQNNGFNL